MEKKYNFGILATHPIQYYVPWYRALAKHPAINLQVFYCHRQTPQGQAQAGFGVPFDWDIPLLDGYEYRFLNNRSFSPGAYNFWGYDTPEISRIIKESRFDAFMVSGWFALSFWQAIIACWSSGTPIMIRGDSQLSGDYHLLKRIIKYPFYRMIMPNFDAYLAVGKRGREYYQHYGAKEQKIFFVPHSVDNDFFSKSCAALEPDREALRKDWGIPPGAVVFLFAGKIINRKSPQDLLKALELVYQRVPEVFGLFVGDGDLRLRLETMAKERSLPVKFTGFLNQKEIAKSYAVSDVLVLPSDEKETWGLVVNEVMACGLPALVSDRVGCGPDLIFSGKTGEVFPYGDIRGLSEVMIKLISHPQDLLGMKMQVREKIKEYSIEKTVEGTLAALGAVVRRGVVKLK